MAWSPVARGVAFALVSAVAFGATTPVVAWAGRTTGPFTTAALLYAGASGASAILRRMSRRTGGALGRQDLGRLIAVAAIGAALAPTLLAWGLQRTGGTAGSLLLNLEAVFTVLLARLLYREVIGGRVAIAVIVMAVGGALLTLDAAAGGSWGAAGIAAVAGATFAWALDNTLTRPLAERDPLQIVMLKGAIGTALTVTCALIAGEALPATAETLALLTCGATGYGLSLRLYLLAQRRIGAARTGSVFALAPFVGGGLAYALGDRDAGAWSLAAAGLFGLGVWLHVTERHGHHHVHEAVEHEHAHRHDDEHHAHRHDPPVSGEHTHPHRHERTEHEHEHALDVHHDHSH